MMGRDTGAGRGLFSNEWRPLTAGEISLCRSVFPDPLPYGEIRLIDGPRANDFAEVAFRNRNTGRRLFLHEMTHVWQWQRLGVVGFLARYARDFLACRGNAHAMYRYESDDTPFAASRLEAQAEMVGDYQRRQWPQRALIERKLQGTGIYDL
jgi:hypothetical protein